MSDWHPQVVRLDKIGQHPNADKLEITQVLGPEHVREGIVVRPVVERIDGHWGERVVLKLAGEGYLTRKQAA